MEKVESFFIRPGIEDDRNLIYASFLKGLYYGNSWFSLIQKDIFMKNYHKIVEHLLNSPQVQVSIACLKSDPNTILGYSLSSGDTLHWVFVKKAWRTIGVARALILPTTRTVTHLTEAGLSMMRKTPSVKFNPFAI